MEDSLPVFFQAYVSSRSPLSSSRGTCCEHIVSTTELTSKQFCSIYCIRTELYSLHKPFSATKGTQAKSLCKSSGFEWKPKNFCSGEISSTGKVLLLFFFPFFKTINRKFITEIWTTVNNFSIPAISVKSKTTANSFCRCYKFFDRFHFPKPVREEVLLE